MLSCIYHPLSSLLSNIHCFAPHSHLWRSYPSTQSQLCFRSHLRSVGCLRLSSSPLAQYQRPSKVRFSCRFCRYGHPGPFLRIGLWYTEVRSTHRMVVVCMFQYVDVVDRAVRSSGFSRVAKVLTMHDYQSSARYEGVMLMSGLTTTHHLKAPVLSRLSLSEELGFIDQIRQ